MKKKIIALLLCLPLLCMTAYAAEERESFDNRAQWEASGAGALFDQLPRETQDDLQQIGIEGNEDELPDALSADRLAGSLLDITQREMHTPFASLGFLLAMLLLAAFFKGGENALDSPLAPTVGTVMSAAVSVTAAAPIIALIGQIGDVVEAACAFTESFAAVLIGILIAEGQTASAAGYSSFVFGAVEVSTVCVEALILPLLNIFLAMSCVSSVSQNIKVDSVIHFFEKNAKWLLSFLAVTLTAILSISGVISASADSLTSRTAKFMISGSVPVVGGAMSDAYLTIKSGMLLLRNSVGAFGMIAVAYVYLPLIVRTMLWNLVMEIGLSLCEGLGLDSIQKLMKSLSGMLSLMLGLLVFSLFLLTLGSIIVVMQKSM